MPCNCGFPPCAGAPGSGTGDMGGPSQDISSMQEGYELSNKFCFKCSIFWVIIGVLFVLLLAGSGRRG